MLRGYVRIQEANGVNLAGEVVDKKIKQAMHISANAGRGYRSSNSPPGVNIHRVRRIASEEN